MVAPNPHRAGEEAEAQRGHGGKGGAGTPGRRPQVLPSQGTEGGGPGLAFGFQRSAELGEQANMRRCQPRRPASVKRAAAPVERRRLASGGPRVCPCHLTRSLPHHRGCEWALRAHCSPHPCDSSPFAHQKLEERRHLKLRLKPLFTHHLAYRLRHSPGRGGRPLAPFSEGGTETRGREVGQLSGEAGPGAEPSTA